MSDRERTVNHFSNTNHDSTETLHWLLGEFGDPFRSCRLPLHVPQYQHRRPPSFPHTSDGTGQHLTTCVDKGICTMKPNHSNHSVYVSVTSLQLKLHFVEYVTSFESLVCLPTFLDYVQACYSGPLADLLTSEKQRTDND